MLWRGGWVRGAVAARVLTRGAGAGTVPGVADDEGSAEFGRLLRQAQVLAWVGVAVLGVAAVVMVGQGQVSALFGVLTGWGLTLWSAVRIGRLRRTRG